MSGVHRPKPESLSLQLERRFDDLGIQVRQRLSDQFAAGYNIVPNRRRDVRISHQRLGEQYCVGGLVRRNADFVRKGLGAFAWILPHQDRSGAFPTNHHGVHGIAFTTAAILYCETIFRGLQSEDWQSERNAIIESAVQAARWFSCEGWGRFWGTESIYSHQIWLLAYTFTLAALERPSPELSAAAHITTRKAIEAQSPEGWYAEMGGPDTNYSTVSTLWAQRLWMATGNRDVERSIDMAVDWVVGQILPDGRIEGSMNSRCGPDGLDRQCGRALGKGLGYPNFARVLIAWGIIRNRSELEESGLACWYARPQPRSARQRQAR